MTAEREKATMLYSASRLEEEMKVVLRGDNSESRVAGQQDDHYAYHGEYGNLFAHPYHFQPQIDDPGGEDVKEQHGHKLRQAQPGGKSRRRAGDETADIDHRGEAQQGEGHPCQELPDFPHKKLPLKATDELGTAVVVGELCDHEVEKEIDEVGCGGRSTGCPTSSCGRRGMGQRGFPHQCRGR